MRVTKNKTKNNAIFEKSVFLLVWETHVHPGKEIYRAPPIKTDREHTSSFFCKTKRRHLRPSSARNIVLPSVLIPYSSCGLVWREWEGHRHRRRRRRRVDCAVCTATIRPARHAVVREPQQAKHHTHWRHLASTKEIHQSSLREREKVYLFLPFFSERLLMRQVFPLDSSRSLCGGTIGDRCPGRRAINFPATESLQHQVKT